MASDACAEDSSAEAMDLRYEVYFMTQTLGKAVNTAIHSYRYQTISTRMNKYHEQNCAIQGNFVCTCDCWGVGNSTLY